MTYLVLFTDDTGCEIEATSKDDAITQAKELYPDKIIKNEPVVCDYLDVPF